MTRNPPKNNHKKVEKSSTYAAFRIPSNPVEESEMWFGVYSAHDRLLRLEIIHDVVPMAEKDAAWDKLKKAYGENVEYIGETKFGPPNFIGYARFGTKDIEAITFDLEKKYRYDEYVFDQTEMAKLKTFSEERDEILERLEGIAQFPHPLLMQYLQAQKQKEEEQIFETLQHFQAQQIFKELLHKDNAEELSEYEDHCEEMKPVIKIQKQRNAM